VEVVGEGESDAMSIKKGRTPKSKYFDLLLQYLCKFAFRLGDG